MACTQLTRTVSTGGDSAAGGAAALGALGATGALDDAAAAPAPAAAPPPRAPPSAQAASSARPRSSAARSVRMRYLPATRLAAIIVHARLGGQRSPRLELIAYPASGADN